MTTDGATRPGLSGRSWRIWTPSLEDLAEIYAITQADDRYQEAKAARAAEAAEDNAEVGDRQATPDDEGRIGESDSPSSEWLPWP